MALVNNLDILHISHLHHEFGHLHIFYSGARYNPDEHTTGWEIKMITGPHKGVTTITAYGEREKVISDLLTKLRLLA